MSTFRWLFKLIIFPMKIGAIQLLTMEECTLSIINKHLEDSYVYFSAGLGEFLGFEIGNASGVILTVPDVKVKGPFDFYLVQSPNLTAVERFLGSMYKSLGWNVAVKLLAIGIENKLVDALFRVTWRYYLANVAVVTANLKLYTYHPMSFNGCNKIQPVLLGGCLNKGTLFNAVAPMFFHGCTYKTAFIYLPPFHINYSSTTNPGLIIKMSQEFQSVLHHKVRYLSNYSTFGVLLTNGTYTLMFRDLYEGNIDYIVGNVGNSSFSYDFEVIPSYFTYEYPFWVPRADKINSWKSLVVIFSKQVWLTYLGTFLLTIFFCRFLKANERGSFRSYQYCVLTIWRLVFSSSNRQPQSFQLGLTVFLWMLVAFLLSAIYQGNMHSILSVPQDDFQVDSIAKLLETDWQIGGSYLPNDAYHNLKTKQAKQVSARLQDCSIRQYCIDRVLAKKDFAVFTEKRYILSNWNKFLDKDGQPKLFRIDSEVSFLSTTNLRKGHPLTKRVRELFARFQENGLFSLWDIYSNYMKYASKKVNYNYLTMEHLLTAFLCLALGLILATLLFLFEIMRKPTNIVFAM